MTWQMTKFISLRSLSKQLIMFRESNYFSFAEPGNSQVQRIKVCFSDVQHQREHKKHGVIVYHCQPI